MKTYPVLRPVIWFLFTVIIIIINSCTTVKNTVPDFLTKEEILKLTGRTEYPEKSEFPDADAVILYEKNICETVVEPHFGTILHYSKAIKVFKNLDRFTTLDIPMWEDDALLGLKARVINPDGTIKEISKEDIIETTSKAHRLEDVEHNKSIIFPDVHENSIIEYSFSISTNRAIFGTSWYLQEFYVPELYEEFKLISPKKAEITEDYWSYGDLYQFTFVTTLDYTSRVNLNNMEGNPKPVKTEDSKNYISTWTFNNVPAFVPESKMPPVSYIMGKIDYRLEQKKGWQTLANLFNKVYKKGTLDTAGFVKKFADSLTKNCTTEKEKINILKNYVQGIRYEAVELGHGGIEPRSPKFIIEKQYGDCKDKASLLVALLKTQGIKAYPAVLLTADEGYVDPNFPTWGFNHMIVYLEDKDKAPHWIDGTVGYCPFDEIPWQDEGINALILYDNDQFEFKDTPLSDYLHNKTIVNEKVSISNEDTVKFSLNFTFYGNDDLEYRNILAEQNEDKKYKALKQLLKDEFADVKLENIHISDYKNLDSTMTISFDFLSTNAFSKQGKMYLMNYDPVDEPYHTGWLTDKERKYTIFNSYGYTFNKNIEIEVPADNLIIQSMPDDLITKDDNFNYSKMVFSDSPFIINSSKNFSSKQIMIQNTEYNKVKDFLTKIVNSDNSRIIFQKMK